MNNELPAGFAYVMPDVKPTLSFDIKHKRFFFGTSLRKENGLGFGSRIGIAYNKADRQVLIDLNGRAFRIDRRGYVTSARFSEQLRLATGYIEESSVKYSVNSDMSNDRFIVLDESYVK